MHHFNVMSEVVNIVYAVIFSVAEGGIAFEDIARTWRLNL